jgi:hypothetical protein
MWPSPVQLICAVYILFDKSVCQINSIIKVKAEQNFTAEKIQEYQKQKYCDIRKPDAAKREKS